jgi:hypothetical protein
MNSNVTFEGDNAVLLSYGNESSWATVPNGYQGIITASGTYPNTGIIENVIIKGFNIYGYNKANGITIFDATNVQILNNYFTGTFNGTGSTSPILLDGQYNHINVDNIKIEENVFKNIAPLSSASTGTIHVHSHSGHTFSNIKIINNDFINARGPAVYLDPSALISNIKIIGNNFINLNVSGSQPADYAVAVMAGLANPYLINNLLIEDNYYENGFTSKPSNNKSGFAFIYSSNNTIISNNRLYYGNVIFGLEESTAFAIGRTSSPNYGLIISNNIIDGFDTFWDPDSTINAEVYGNVIKNSGGAIGIGYGIQQNIHIHDNIWTNYKNQRFGQVDTLSGLSGFIVLANSNPQNSIIENNVINEYSNIVMNGSLILTGPTFNFNNVTIRNNYINGNIPITQIYNQVSSIPRPLIIQGNNFIADNYTTISPNGSLYRCAINNSGSLNCG